MLASFHDTEVARLSVATEYNQFANTTNCPFIQEERRYFAVARPPPRLTEVFTSPKENSTTMDHASASGVWLATFVNAGSYELSPVRRDAALLLPRLAPGGFPLS